MPTERCFDSFAVKLQQEYIEKQTNLNLKAPTSVTEPSVYQTISVGGGIVAFLSLQSSLDSMLTRYGLENVILTSKYP